MIAREGIVPGATEKALQLQFKAITCVQYVKIVSILLKYKNLCFIWLVYAYNYGFSLLSCWGVDGISTFHKIFGEWPKNAKHYLGLKSKGWFS